MTEPARLADVLAEYVRALVDDAPPLSSAQADRLRGLLAPPAHTPAPRAPIPVTSAGTASHRLSAGARPHPTPFGPQRPAQPHHGALRRPTFGATPEASS